MKEYSRVKQVLFSIFCGLSSIHLLYAQDTTSIPDPNFEQTLIDLGIDSDGVINSEVLTDDINTITELNIFNQEIDNLTGIEDFDSLKNLNCSNNRLTTIDIRQNTKLTDLNISSNALDSLDVSVNFSLEELYCQDNLLTYLDVKSNEQLKILDFTSNQIIDINISKNTSLTKLKCANNQLTKLNVESTVHLTELICSTNLIDSLDVSKNELLTTLFCASNQLTDLYLTENDSLVFLDCSGNQLTSLDVSMNKVLKQLSCSANQITSLIIDQIDSLTLLACSNNQLTSLNVSENIELENLICASNQLSWLEVHANFTLRSLDFSFNLISSADLSQNDSLSFLNCSNNQLRSLNVKNGNNGELVFFNALGNPQLTCINIDDKSEIGDTWLKDNTATYSENCDPIQTYLPDNNFEQALIDLGLDSGSLDSLVVTDSIKTLKVLDISGKNISDLMGIQDFLQLESLNCSNNQIIILDLIKNTSLTSINCSSNVLISLIIKNNNNANLTTFDAQDNPPLTCIAVDDETQTGGAWLKDVGASYSDNCNPGQTFVPDDNFEQKLIDLGLDIVLDNYVLTDSIDTITVLDVDSLFISDLTGIEEFLSLESLDCSSNTLTTLDISRNDSLLSLSCFGNYLTELIVSNNDSLIFLNCGDNRLSDLDVNQNTNLKELIIDSNFFTEIDITGNPDLVILNCNSNKITESGLDLISAAKLEKLFCSNNKLRALDITQNDLLVELDFSSNYLEGIDLSANDSLRKLDCSLNVLTGLDVDSNTKLDTINCNFNQLENLTFLLNPLLRFISSDNNQLTDINLTKNDSLQTLLISFNNLPILDVSNNKILNIFHCDDNRLDDLDITNNPVLLDLSCANNQLDSLDLSNNILLLGLDCDDNNLNNLDVSVNIGLLELSIANNQIDSINTSSNMALTSLICHENKLTFLILDHNTLLLNLSCAGNEITGLDLSFQTELTALNSSSNQLTSLSIKNGNIDQLKTFNTINNPDLYCIEVDDIAKVDSAWQKDEQASFSENCHYNDTYIPDDGFEQAIIDLGLDAAPLDDYVMISAIDTVEVLNMSGRSISELTGIQEFSSLIILDISNNDIDSINLSNNGALVNLNCSGNQLNKLDISNNTALEVVDISANLLAEMNFDSLTSLLSVSCDFNEFISLNFNNNAVLTTLSCASNQLTSLIVKNGNNTSLTTFNSTGNPDLTCIEIDDETIIGSGWQKDNTASYSTNCHYNETYIPNDAFEQALINLGYDYSSAGPLDDYVPTARINMISTLNIRNKDIIDLTGIEDFVELVNLNCSNNRLTNVDIRNNSMLKFLNCSGNQLVELDISLNALLIDLDISGNSLTNIDIRQNSDLIQLNCSSNQLTSLDIIQNINLDEVFAQYNQLFSVDANNGHNQNLSTFDLSNNPNLSCILVDNIVEAEGFTGWIKDQEAQYKLECNDDDNDGIIDDKDDCPATPFGDAVDLFGCSVFRLPIDNFSISTTGETCRNSNNGKINVTAIETYNYIATLTGNEESKTYKFTNTLEIRNVRAETYEFCLTIESQHDYKQCYTLVITEPEDLVVIPVEGLSGGRIAYQMSGGSNYVIDFNGLVFETNDDYISLSLEDGHNSIRIKTDVDCQGMFEETIFLSDDILLFPIPFENYLHVNLGNNQTGEIQIDIYSTSGILVRSGKYQAQNGNIDIETSSLASGVYVIDLKRKEGQTSFKIVKE